MSNDLLCKHGNLHKIRMHEFEHFLNVDNVIAVVQCQTPIFNEFHEMIVPTAVSDKSETALHENRMPRIRAHHEHIRCKCKRRKKNKRKRRRFVPNGASATFTSFFFLLRSAGDSSWPLDANHFPIFISIAMSFGDARCLSHVHWWWRRTAAATQRTALIVQCIVME